MNTFKKRVLCIAYLRGLCNNSHCELFHPIKLKNFFAHWTLCIDDQGDSFSIRANSIGFDKSNKKKIRNEFFILLKNLALYQQDIKVLQLYLYDPLYPHYEDPFFNEENYNEIFYSLSKFKYLKNLEIDIGSLFPLFRCKQAFGKMFSELYSLTKFTLETQSNNDDRMKSDFDYNEGIDILAQQKHLHSIYIRLNEPSKNDMLLFNLLQESQNSKITFELRNIVEISVATNPSKDFSRELRLLVVDEGFVNRDPFKIMDFLRRIIQKNPTSLTSFKYHLEGLEKNANAIGVFHRSWITFFNFQNMKFLKVIDLNLSEFFFNGKGNLEYFFKNCLNNVRNLKKFSFNKKNAFYSRGLLFPDEFFPDLRRFLFNNQKSLNILSIQNISFENKWPDFKYLFEVISNMASLFSLDLSIYNENVILQANFKELSWIFRKFLEKAHYLVDLRMGFFFRDQSISSLAKSYSHFLLKKKILIIFATLFKKKERYKHFRKEIFLEIALENLLLLKPIECQLPSNPFDLSSNGQNIGIRYRQIRDFE